MAVHELVQAESNKRALDLTKSPPLEAWNEYLAGRPGCLFHRAEWEGVFAAYGLPLCRLAAVRGGRIVGVLPLVPQRSLLFGNQLVSLPWFDAAGVLADDDQARAALIEKAMGLLADCGARVLQLRHAEPLDVSPHVRTDKVILQLRLEHDPQRLWKRFKPEVRNQVRKAQKLGLVASRGGPELLEHFFRVYSENMRDLGSPSHSMSFFRSVFDTFPEQTTTYVVRLGDAVIGAGLTMANGDRLEIPWASSLRSYNGHCVNHLMYWQILEDACQRGFDWFSFGRSTPGSGPYNFKKQWGPEDVQLYWYFLDRKGRAARAARPPQDSYGWCTRLWRRLPLWLARRLGPRMIARIP